MARTLGAIVVAMLAAGCPQGLFPCRAVGDCAAPDVCVAGKCTPSCDSDADCSGGQVCSNGLCGAGGEGEGAAEGEGGAGEGEGSPGEGEGAAGEGEGAGGEGEGAGEGEGEGGAVNCGNNAFDAGETCDDGNQASGDGCDPSCHVEAGFVCTPLTRAPPSICAQLPVDDTTCDATDPFHKDVNGDCLPDVVVGAPNLAAASIVQGIQNGDFTLISPPLGDDNDLTSHFGASVAIEPDTNAQHQRGIYVSRPGNGEVLRFDTGQAFLNVTPGILTKTGSTTLGARALAVLRAGPAQKGALLFDDAGVLFATHTVPAAGATVEATATSIVDATPGAVTSVAIGPDEDGDGLPDIFAGAPGGGATSGGRGPVFFLSSLTFEVVGRRFTPPANAPSFGEVVVSLGDIDGDNIDDLAIAAPREGRGRVFVNLSTGGVNLIEVTAPSIYSDKARFGQAMSAIGDVDGDGHSEIMVGAPFDDNGGKLPGGASCTAQADCDTAFPGVGTTCDVASGNCVDAANDPHCQTFLGDASYGGDCGGGIALVKSVDLLAAAAGAGGTAPSQQCIDADENTPGLRAGFSITGLGPPPPGAPAGGQRVAIGAPGDSLRVDGAQTGFVFFATIVLDPNGTCAGSTFSRLDGPFAGSEFGAALGR